MKRSRELDEDLDFDSHADNPHVYLRPAAKYTELDSEVAATSRNDDDDDASAAGVTAATVMKCSLPPHRDPVTFRTYSEYEAHYNKFHTNRCLECRKNFPSEHLLGIHIEECHDPLIVVRRDRGEHTFSCFVEGCERKCLTHQKRRMHMIDKHMYPKNYFFAITKEGIDGRRSLLVEGGHRRRRSSTSAQAKESRRRESLQGAGDQQQQQQKKDSNADGAEDSNKGETATTDSHEKPDTEMEDLTGAMSSLQFVPPSVRFGRQRAGFSRR
ncbi:Zinc finger protein-like protein [Hapsidospora chrysogenum ATCC 11550]|uniref:Zinc finger protein-like protein n=1 Tax=Hapsidospora chrysogenum (strain ATCC 11550 / CBS 779.69 / DSM 880 / IAM 14645 / JCM 23072 / IMI 49137) TaxID=857340 RepID=A0A086TF74_HAPC1|nr:Zinc finger protein-like protein [Hapsidospora chrysogenum ATCC 11550]